MATSRMLAKSISVSSQVNSMSRFARLLFTWMIAHADDWGVMVGEARRVRALVLPMDDDATDAEVDAALAEMEAQELIWRYRDARGTPLLQFRTWETHQHGLHKRTAPKLPRYSDMVADTQSPIQELPGSSGKFRANRTELKGTEQNVITPTVSAADATDVSAPAADVSAPAARSVKQPSSPAELPARQKSDTTDRAYWERVMRDLPSVQRIPTLVALAQEKIGTDATPGGAAYARIGQLAKKHTASLVAVWILQAAASHISGDPLDYLTKIAAGQIARTSPSGGGGRRASVADPAPTPRVPQRPTPGVSGEPIPIPSRRATLASHG